MVTTSEDCHEASVEAAWPERGLRNTARSPPVTVPVPSFPSSAAYEDAQRPTVHRGAQFGTSRLRPGAVLFWAFLERMEA